MLRKTALHNLHEKLGAKMGEFAGYDMPLYYDEGVIKEHLWVRESCGLFDVSHMGQAMLKGTDGGRDALDFIQHITPSSFEKLGIDRTKYTVLLNEQGGIIDDLMVTRTGENDFHLVINAGCKEKDLAHIQSHLPETVELNHFEDWALLALQGPKAEESLKDALDIDTASMPYMALIAAKYKDQDIYVSRLGYTGEDGFEIAVHKDNAAQMAEDLLTLDAVKPIGLAARDSLRLEMGYALHGHDINAETSPVDAGIGWVIGKDRKDYIGYARIHKDLSEGVARKLVGIELIGKGVAREGAEIRSVEDEVIGTMTSGGHSPCLKKSIGMAYVDSAMANIGADVMVNVRGRNIEAKVASLPFIPASTKSMKKKAA